MARYCHHHLDNYSILNGWHLNGYFFSHRQQPLQYYGQYAHIMDN
ncbi:oprC-like outer membrane copper receptor domain protein, partial [Acinetobacter baumannii 45057_1]